MRRFAFCALLFVWALYAQSPPPDFQRDVRPILSKRCFACHGPDEEGRKAGVRLDQFETASKLKTRIIARVTHASRPMPPVGPRLTEAEVSTLRQWIDSGMAYTNHWAYEKPKRPPTPAVKATAWVRNPIDAFVLARLEKEGLQPSPQADKPTLARRAALDLTGLPPDPAMLAKFLADPKSGAYERYVDDLLASPRYGERWAKIWLDLARYADTQGYEKDNRRSIWPYRDWVIRAFNDNLPFDKFTITQIAGDLLPDPTIDDLIATGFHRNTMTNTEGGTDDEEFRDLAIRDRVATTGQIFMGQTWGCAQCHSHKYDPISHKEFYQVYAFFNQTEDNDHPSDRPVLKLDAKTSTLIMRDRPKTDQRVTRIFERGNFLSPGAEVEAGTPAFLPPMPKGAPMNRLGLAQWLVSEDNPLTARVTANRFWSRIFGRGIVESEEDFGTQGIPPTHPELLDWLAVELMSHNWDVKALLKTMVTSATYRQSSDTTPELQKHDPQNKLYARGARFRLDAEMVRDQALAAAGMLSTKMYGPPVMPFQPDGVWLVVYNGERWDPSKGEDRYRRSLYTFMRRTSPYPSMANFDAPTGEVCTMRRIRTNTPLQALTTMNDPVFMEAAQKLAARALAESPKDPVTRIFELVLGRTPSAAELRRVLALRKQTEAELKSEPENALQLTKYSESLYEGDRDTRLLADSRDGGADWRYSTTEPSKDWAAANFDDSSWPAGKGYFGDLVKPVAGVKIGTSWKTEALWLRTVIDLPEKLPRNFRLEARLNPWMEVWVNGVPALNNALERVGYFQYQLGSDGQKAFHPGRNVIAIKLTVNHSGRNEGQFFDAGMIASLPPELGSPSKRDASMASWVVVANTILNLDETVTRR